MATQDKPADKPADKPRELDENERKFVDLVKHAIGETVSEAASTRTGENDEQNKGGILRTIFGPLFS